MGSPIDPSFADLTGFRAVARHRSFRRAAEAIGVSRSALSHGVAGLERRLGVRLLHRTTRSVAPTEVGARLLERLEPLLSGLAEALDEAAGARGSPTGTVRISAPAPAVRWLLRHAVPAFLARHPGMAIDLVADGRLVDIVAAGFDAGVRLAESVPQDMVAVPFGGPARFVAVASPGYLAQAGRPDVPDDLHRQRCIRHRLQSGRLFRWEFARGAAEIAVDVPGPLTLDDIGLMVEAAADGLGIAYVPEDAAAIPLAEGRLEVVLGDWSPPLPGLSLYYPGHRHVPAGLRAFADILKATRD
jgi:DNA-binding transcriptional LysR family regulator